jgi:hypothetical protein
MVRWSGLRAVALLFAFASLLGVSGCSSSPGATYRDRIAETLEEYAVGDESSVQLDEVIDGDWDRLAIFCWKMDRESVEEALGFAWDPSSMGVNLDRTDQLLLFVSGDSVEIAIADAGAFNPNLCTYASYEAFDDDIEPRVIERSQSTMSFFLQEPAEFDFLGTHSGHQWAVDPASIQTTGNE